MSREVSGAHSPTTASAAEPAGAVVEGGAVIAKRVPRIELLDHLLIFGRLQLLDAGLAVGSKPN